MTQEIIMNLVIATQSLNNSWKSKVLDAVQYKITLVPSQYSIALKNINSLNKYALPLNVTLKQAKASTIGPIMINIMFIPYKNKLNLIIVEIVLDSKVETQVYSAIYRTTMISWYNSQKFCLKSWSRNRYCTITRQLQ